MKVNQLVLKRDVNKWNKLIESIKKQNIDQDTDEIKAFHQLSNVFKNNFNQSENEKWIGNIKNNLNKYASDRNIQADLKDFAALCSVWMIKTEEDFNIFKKALNTPEQKTVIEGNTDTSKVDNSEINQILLNRDIEKFRTITYLINKAFDSLDVGEQSAFEILSKYYQHHFDKNECEELIGSIKGSLNKYSSNRDLQSNLKDFTAICTIWYTKTEHEFAEFRKAMGAKERKPIIVEEKKEKEPQKKNDRINYSDGSYYIGEILNGIPHGRGKYYWKDGDWHDGGWLNGVQSGQGTFYSASYNRTDTGIYKNGERYGKGKMVWADGRWYEGGWNNNGPHGQGTYYNSDSKRTDIGDFIDANRDGYGTMKWDGGDRYEGTWQDTDNGLRGKGIYYFANGYSESGYFENGEWVKSFNFQSYNKNKEQESGQSSSFYWVRTHKFVTFLLVVIFVIVSSSVYNLLNKDYSSNEIETSVIEPNYYVVAKTLNIRKDPSTRSAKTGQLKYGDKVRIEVYDVGATEFAQINYQGMKGYVSNKYLRPINASGNNEIKETQETEKTYSSDMASQTTGSISEIAPESEIDIEDLIAGENTRNTITQHSKTSDNKNRERTEQMPVFPGGGDALFLFLQQNLVYPTVSSENGIQGRVLLRFMVDKTGSISDITVLNSLDPYCDREAIRVIKSMPRWNPGIQDGKPVSVSYTLPIVFRLN